MITTEKIFEIWETENLTIKDIIKEKFLQFENIWYDLIDVFFDEKEFWDYFFIDSKDLILVLELLENKKAKPNLVLKFENKKGSLFYFKIDLKK